MAREQLTEPLRAWVYTRFRQCLIDALCKRNLLALHGMTIGGAITLSLSFTL